MLDYTRLGNHLNLIAYISTLIHVKLISTSEVSINVVVKYVDAGDGNGIGYGYGDGYGNGNGIGYGSGDGCG